MRIVSENSAGITCNRLFPLRTPFLHLPINHTQGDARLVGSMVIMSLSRSMAVAGNLTARKLLVRIGRLLEVWSGTEVGKVGVGGREGFGRRK